MKYVYIGIVTASLLVLTNAGNGFSVREKRQANASQLQAIVESGKALAEIMEAIQGIVADALSSYIGDLDEEVRKIDIRFDGLKAEERRYIEDAHTLLTTSGTKLFLLRQTLTLLAKETIERSNRIIKVFKMVEDDPDNASQLINYSQKKMNQLFIRSKDILKQSLVEYNDILKNVASTKTKLESFIRLVDGLGNDDNERFKQWKKEMRVKVYGGSAACVIAAPICAILYPLAAGFLESKIKKRKEAVKRLINAARSAETNAKNLKKIVDEKEKYVVREIDLVNKWSSQVAQNSEEYASPEDILEFIEIFGQKDAISMLCALTKASKDYIDHKLPGLEQYEITAPALDSACSGSGTPTPDKPTTVSSIRIASGQRLSYLSSTPFAQVNLREHLDDHSGRQEWIFRHLYDDVYNILVSRESNAGKKYLSCRADGFVDLWTQGGGQRQQWRIQWIIGENTYNIRVLGDTNPGKEFLSCTEDGLVDLYSHEGIRQRWKVTSVSSIRIASGQRLSYLSSERNGRVYLKEHLDDHSGRQKWSFKHLFDDVYNILVSGGTADGEKYLSCRADGFVDLWTHGGGHRQMWRIQRIDKNIYNIRVFGGTKQGKEFLSCTKDGLVDLYSHEGIRQRWQIAF